MPRPVVVVTGGASNIGWACVQRFAPTHQVLIGDLRAPAVAVPDGVHVQHADITDEASGQALLARAAAMGTVEAVVHSAAITAPALPFEQVPVDEWRRIIEVNLTGAFLVARAALPVLRATRGSLVMIASRAARTGYAALVPTPQGTKPHYSASKAGVLSLVKSLAIETAADGMRVNAVVPGSIEGTMIPRERWPELAAHIPMRRLGLPEEVADVVHFLCSPAARYVTGQSVDVNGGTWMT